jgi:hypothetical protein
MFYLRKLNSSLRCIRVFLSPKIPTRYPSTLFTTSSSPLGNVCVFRRIRMALRTVCNKVFTTYNVLAKCNRLQMRRINTESITTKMINAKVYRYLTFIQFISKTMRTYRPFTNRKFTIPSITYQSCPQPASICFINSFPKSLFYRNFTHTTIIPHSKFKVTLLGGAL